MLPRSRSLVLPLITLTLACSGGSDDEKKGPPPAGGCAARDLNGICAGVDSAALCDEDPCTGDLVCSLTVVVATDAELVAALAQAAPGSCVAVKTGQYQTAEVPAGVALLGRGAALVSIGSVTLNGDGAALRGVRVAGGEVLVNGAGARLDQVKVEASIDDGIELSAGASLTVAHSEIQGSKRHGISAFDATSLALESTVVEGSEGPGLWVQCSAGCACPQPIALSATDVVISNNKIVGLSLVGAEAVLNRVHVLDHGVGSGFKGSGGIAASQCSGLTATALKVLDNSEYGILMDDSRASLGGTTAEAGIEISRNLRGIWIQNGGQSKPGEVIVENCLLSGNEGVGLGMDGSSTAVTVTGCEVSDTSVISLPVLIGGLSAGVEKVGDGVSWVRGARGVLNGITLRGNGRASVLIDGPVADGSAIAELVLEAGDDVLGVLQQNLLPGGGQPSVGQGAPAVETQATEKFPIPVPPGIPPGI